MWSELFCGALSRCVRRVARGGFLVGCAWLAVEAAPARGAKELELQAVRVRSRIDVTVGGDLFTTYRFSADEKYPFFFPVNAPSGAGVTSMRNGKYPHHASLFFGCDKVNGGNYWQDRLEAGQIISDGAVLVQAGGREVVIADACNWVRPGAPSPLRDRRTIRITAPDATTRVIDVEIALEALEDVEIGKTNHSWFSVRMDPDLTPAFGGTLVNAEGKTGEKATFGEVSGWMACFGKRGGGGIEGLALFQHPTNRWAPAPWFTRDYGFMSPTPMYWPADGKATRLAKGEVVRLNYRVVVFAGEKARASLPAQFADYAAGRP